MAEWTNVFLFIAGVAVSFLGAVSKYLFDKVQSHETRIQSVEQVQGTKLDQLEKKIDKIETAIETLANNIHKEKNQEGQLTHAITALLKHLERNEQHQRVN
jgi:TolA-binding protein